MLGLLEHSCLECLVLWVEDHAWKCGRSHSTDVATTCSSRSNASSASALLVDFKRARPSRSFPDPISTKHSEAHSGGRGMPSGRGLSVGVYSSLPLPSSHPLNDVVSLITIVPSPLLRHDLSLTLPLILLSSSRASPPCRPALPYVARDTHTPVCTHATSSSSLIKRTSVYLPVSSSPGVFYPLECPVDHRYRTHQSFTSHPRQADLSCPILGLLSRSSPRGTGRSSCTILGLPSRSKTTGSRVLRTVNTRTGAGSFISGHKQRARYRGCSQSEHWKRWVLLTNASRLTPPTVG